MRPAWWSTIGLSLDIFGALLLGAEAVTLDRVGRWRERVIQSRRRILHAGAVSLEEDAWRPSRRANLAVWLALITVAYPVEAITLKFGFGTTPDAVARDLISGENLAERGLRFVIGVVVGGFVLSLAVLVISIVLASLATALARGLLWVHERTPGGTVGLFGVVFLLLGFLGQLVAAWTR